MAGEGTRFLILLETVSSKHRTMEIAMATAITFGQILTIAPTDDVLTDDIKGKLEAVWGELPASEIGAKNIAEMAIELLVILPDPDHNNDNRMAVAEAINGLLKRLNLIPAAPVQPLKVTFDKTPETMSLRELLETLVDQPDRYTELLPFIENDQQVRTAATKAKGVWAIPAPKLLDVDLTLAYVAHLGHRFASVQEIFQGRRPLTLAKAMGRDDRPLLHFFTGRPVYGPDENGFDISTIDPELHEALVWARATNHSAWPQQIDLYTYTEEVLTTPLPRRWQRILSSYQHAKQTGDDSVRGISRYWSEDWTRNLTGLIVELHSEAGPQSGFTKRPNYEQLVRDAGLLNGRLAAQGSNNDYNGGVFDRVNIQGSNNNVNGVVAVRGGTIMGSNNDGNLLLPPGVRVSVTGSSNDINQRNMSWEDLARHLGLI